ncbi:ABC transporter ATP-binding protein [Parasphaerochaeta coccoides]|uniref:ABC transporter related protein n=1 Tax=Parasphaerochaeta coccoides (strain ATCC BAA-1237 / DSM 17374 / SPN1) TaxID=760011 RepID=F4GLG6_PARC1|nr:ABC transporter ATP-binding protein [Parasphaerochaeta coccoides]AEC01936.1 ABC transporter related protein [Parasphaerochaeta coccoides DSM 17374]
MNDDRVETDASGGEDEILIGFSHVTKRYAIQAEPALSEVSFSVRAGEIFGFLGPNGAGKTTAIKTMTGMLMPDSGIVKICGFRITDSPEDVKKIIGYVPDEPLFYENMTGRSYSRFICDIFQTGPERDERIERMAQVFSFSEALDAKISSYSHGMKQKLGIICALAHAPRVLILDEPMVGLDPRSVYLLKDVMREFCNLGGSVFFSTHVLDVAERLCDRVGIISRGRLLFEGTFDELKETSGSTGTATLEELFLKLTGEDSASLEHAGKSVKEALL